MNWAWAASLDQLWRPPLFAMWLTLAAAGFFGVVAVIAMVRADKSFANAALTIIALMAVGMVTSATFRELAPAGQVASTTAAPMNSVVPALSCIDDLAGDTVLAACERALFGSAENAAAAVSYAATQISRLTAVGDVATANRNMTLELHTLRRSVERDRYGLMAQVLLARDHCSPSDCAAFRALTDNRQIVANMDQRVYEGLISRYAPLWTSPVLSGTAAPVAMLSSSMPTGKPTNAEFPSAASTPAVSIMFSEPAAGGAAGTARAAAPAPSSSANAPLPSPRPAATQAAPKKPAAAKHTTAGPVQLAQPPAASAPETSND